MSRYSLSIAIALFPTCSNTYCQIGHRTTDKPRRGRPHAATTYPCLPTPEQPRSHHNQPTRPATRQAGPTALLFLLGMAVFHSFFLASRRMGPSLLLSPLRQPSGVTACAFHSRANAASTSSSTTSFLLSCPPGASASFAEAAAAAVAATVAPAAVSLR
ncbi:hypothetical protein HDK90DRAFT_499961 [Phyllosticta capitalensis]|uniref:Uncharacterized protein n=1 Tax=Phyllosticta capitalensis TaxID=121624 RepID=A0ABR1YA38_9PEZI